ncbi:MAG: hypothetical protein B1H04_00910 [Planctomycetales bacterium 4484_123]|nr:MAG: hypothetical protein B1H04_00910 [Planctomycetales bacterium 4484_123]
MSRGLAGGGTPWQDCCVPLESEVAKRWACGLTGPDGPAWEFVRAAWIGWAALVLWLAPARAAEPGSAPAGADPARIGRLVEQLGAEKYHLRQQAEEELIRIGPPAVKALERALKSDDAEVRARAAKALAQIRKGAFRRRCEAVQQNLLWRAPLAEGASDGPVVAGGTAMCMLLDGRAYAVDAATGKKLWEAACRPDGGLLAREAVVYLVSPAGVLKALDAGTGRAVKDFKGPEVAGRPSLCGGIIYAAAKTGKALLAVDAATGRARWRGALPGKVPVQVAPVAAGRLVYVATDHGRVHALDIARSGRPGAATRWARRCRWH